MWGLVGPVGSADELLLLLGRLVAGGLLRLDLLDRAACLTPGAEAAADVGDRLQSHLLRGLGGQRRAPAARAMKHELLVLLEDRLRIGARRIDPEFQHA